MVLLTITVNINSGTPSYALLVSVLNDAGKVVSLLQLLLPHPAYKKIWFARFDGTTKYTIIVIDQCGNTDYITNYHLTQIVLTKKFHSRQNAHRAPTPDGGADMNNHCNYGRCYTKNY